ncbi:IclR family transcriptional regulator [Streptomyces sp. NBC_01619]|uniref:IclR family transcriptional regulator n=1 Tax=Streptomyces sp. NBC_01619 TaxID=2975901 RepID=UPI00224E1231|nr:IclR family transcriptional regulator [Streptomyces sp. NBC_01619]MCX4515828.1 IclR family transcriptional regulator [Streptomyces sp. NBC_01619]
MDLLDVLSSQEAIRASGLGVSRIARLCGRDKSQVSRALAGLLQVGLVDRDPETLAYRCGWRLYDLAAATRESHMVHSAGPCMQRLAAEVGQPAYLCVLRGDNVVVLLAESASQISRGAGVEGLTVPILYTSAGRVLMSEWEENAVRAAFAQMPTMHGLSGVDALWEELQRIRSAGYAQLDGQFHNVLGGVAVPVRDFRARIVAAISVPSQPSRTSQGPDATYRATLHCAVHLSYALGYPAGTCWGW